ncbi:MAG: GNAT family N-acetyltransferase [Pseudomonadota bacterium]
MLRPFVLQDAADVQRLAGDRAIADTTLNIPHPYEDGAAEQWISGHRKQFRAGTHAVFAMIEKRSGQLIGTASLTVDKLCNKAELGYWVGKPFWNQGFATEAAASVVAYGFAELGLNRIGSRHVVRNPASGKVMQKLGMQQEGILRQDALKWGEYEDLCVYGLLKQEWQARRG